MNISKTNTGFKPIFLGALLWILAIIIQIPYSVFELTHVEILLTAAPLWLIPLAWKNSNFSKSAIALAVFCGILFTVAFHLERGIISGILVLPWLILCLSFLYRKLIFSIDYYKKQDIAALVELAAYFYLPVGILWSLADRVGFRPMGFDPTIVLLTGIHFHYAGYLLPQLTSWLIKRFKPKFSKVIASGIISGIPLVALGITSSHLDLPYWIEVVSVTIMTSFGFIVGLLHLFYAEKTGNTVSRICFCLGGLALLIGMVLAFCYGWRHIFVIEVLTIPWMYAVHGTCNALGFALPILIAWTIIKQQH